MNFLQKIFNAFQPARQSRNSNMRKPFEEKHEETGVFSYDDDGFTINTENIKSKIRWADITELNVYKTDLMTIDRIDMEIVYDDKCITISEDLSGWHLFMRKTEEALPGMDKEWYNKVVQPPFATNHTTIYKSKS